MDNTTIALLALQAAQATLLALGKVESAKALQRAIDGHQAGVNVDAYMALVTQKLKDGTLDTPADVRSRIELEVAEFLSNEVKP